MTLRGEMLRWEWSYVKWLTSFQRTSTTEHTTRQIRVPDTTNIDGHLSFRQKAAVMDEKEIVPRCELWNSWMLC
jgi:hypothetical protein